MPTARELLAEKYLKDPDFIPPEGKTKEEVAGEIVDQKIRQSRNNSRAFQLLAKEQDNAMWTWDRDKDAVQKPIERKKDRFIVKDSPTKFKDPSNEHLRVMHRSLEILPGNVDDYKVDDPPKVDSKEFEAELKHVKSAAKFLQGDPSLEATIKEQDKDLIKPFTDYADENNLSVDETFLDKLAEDVVSIVMFWKYKYNHPRPYQFDGYPEMENTTADTPSYPSGHSAQTKVIGEVLARSYPKHADDFRRIGDNIEVNRVIAGWHYPVDHTTGQDLADQIIEKLPDNVEMFLKKASFDEDLYVSAVRGAMEKHAADFNIPSGLDIQKKEKDDIGTAETGRRAQASVAISPEAAQKIFLDYVEAVGLEGVDGVVLSREQLESQMPGVIRQTNVLRQGGSFIDLVHAMTMNHHGVRYDDDKITDEQIKQTDDILSGIKFKGTGSKELNSHVKTLREFTELDAKGIADEGEAGSRISDSSAKATQSPGQKKTTRGKREAGGKRTQGKEAKEEQILEGRETERKRVEAIDEAARKAKIDAQKTGDTGPWNPTQTINDDAADAASSDDSEAGKPKAKKTRKKKAAKKTETKDA